MKFNIKVSNIPADESFWARQVLIAVQSAIIEAECPEHQQLLDAMFDGCAEAWGDLFNREDDCRARARQQRRAEATF